MNNKDLAEEDLVWMPDISVVANIYCHNTAELSIGRLTDPSAVWPG